MAGGCPQEAIPAGWKVWRGGVPTVLSQFAIDVRDHIHKYAYGSIAETVEYNGEVVGAFKSHHTWTYVRGKLITGICIPGVSLVRQVPPQPGETATRDTLSTPDPDAAVYGADQGIAWGTVAITGVATATIITLFILALKHAAGKSPKRLPAKR